MSRDIKYIGYLESQIADILFTVHKGAPFPRWWCDNHNLLQEGRPFIMRFQHLHLRMGAIWVQPLALDSPQIPDADAHRNCDCKNPHNRASVPDKICLQRN